MRVFQFSLVVTDHDAVTANKARDIAKELFRTGVEDCIVSPKANAIYIKFEREADSYEEALISAIKNVNAVSGLKPKSIDRGHI